jgi:hypothetical protein
MPDMQYACGNASRRAALLCQYLLACPIGPVRSSGQNVSATAGELLAIRSMYIVCTVAHTACPNVSGGLVEVTFHCFDLGHTIPGASSIRTWLVTAPNKQMQYHALRHMSDWTCVVTSCGKLVQEFIMHQKWWLSASSSHVALSRTCSTCLFLT